MSAPQSSVDVEPTLTILQFKEHISSTVGESDPAKIRVIFSGRVLKDEQSLQQAGVSDNCTVHIVKSQAPAAPRPAAAQPPAETPVTAPFATPQQPPAAPPRQQPPSFFPGAMGGMPSMDSLQQQMMNNPELMQSLLNSPMMDAVMSNPEMLRQMMEHNPMFQQLSAQNPEIASVLSDPDTMRQAMEMMRNPDLFRETMAAQERTMNMLSNMPGGERAIRDAYESIDGLAGFTPAQPRPQETPVSVTGDQPQQQEFPSLGGSQQRPSTQAPSFGSMMDPSTIGGMMQSPAVQQMMSQLASNPAALSQMMGSNPFLSAADPSMMSQVFSNPAVMRELQNPDTVAALARLQAAMSSGSQQQAPTQPRPQQPPMPRAPAQEQLSMEQMLERYKPQLDQMMEMGLCGASGADREQCARLVHQSAGNLQFAIERYYAQM
ncbi:hypothetical protein RCL1_005003 [Eukaryota sp. TZLM3-RCL]